MVAALTVTTMVCWMLLPAGRLPILQVTMLTVLLQPADAEVKVTPGGKVSVMVTPFALVGPLLVMVKVYVNG